MAGEYERRRRWEPCGAACGSWERFDEDVRCLERLGANAYRLSLEWSRLEPEPGVFRDEVLRRYQEWIVRLRSAGIEPVVTLHHFSEPAWLLRAHPDGWADPAVPTRFAAFAERVAQGLAPSVRWWTTINEPMVFLLSAYGVGLYPPGRRAWLGLERTFHDTLIPALAGAHRAAYEAVKRRRPDARVSFAHHVVDLLPARPGDEAALDRWDAFFHRRFLDLVRDRLDFLGLNYYTRVHVARPRLPLPLGALPGHAEYEAGLTPALFRLLGGMRGGEPRTDMDWEIVPEGFRRVVTRFSRDYGLPILITENGIADAGGARREAYLRSHLTALKGAMDGGAEVSGYLHWSLTDNWEWGSYRPRFGLFDRERRPAGGCEFYARVCREGGFS